MAVQHMISIVIPVYNEAENIPELYRRLTQAAAAWDEEYEVISVDDGSSDAATVPAAPVNSLFAGLSRLEQRLMRLDLRWPLGSSLLAVVAKPHALSG